MPRKKAINRGRPGKNLTPLDPTRSHAGILDLPNELLLMIFEGLANAHLYSLALLCKRLHHFSLRAYFHRHRLSVDDTGLATINVDIRMVLPFLRLATFVTSIRSLNCIISSCSIGQTLGIHRLVSRMRHIFSVTFKLHLNPCCLAGSHHALKAHKALWMIVDSLADKSCQNFTIRSSREWEMHDSDMWPLLKTRTLKHLGHVEIHGEYIFLPVLIDWTINSLNTSPVTTLILDLSPRSPDLWAEIFIRLTLPSLRHLSICASSLPLNALSGFLLRHPQIVRLTIDQPALVPTNVARLPPEALPHMSFLNANASYLCHLLAPLHTFPALQNVTVKCSSLDRSTATRVLFQVLTLLSHYETVNYLTLPLDIVPLTGRHSSRKRPEYRLHHITHLDLDLKKHPTGLTEDMEALLPCWLGLFPALQSVKFIGRSVKNKNRCVKDFVKAIVDACPTMQTVGYGYNTHTVAAWLELPD